MEPLDHEYSYGKLIEIRRNRAIIEELGYYSGRIVSIHIRFIKHFLMSGGTTLSLAKLSSAEQDKKKKEAMALGMLMSLILFGLMLYKVIII